MSYLTARLARRCEGPSKEAAIAHCLRNIDELEIDVPDQVFESLGTTREEYLEFVAKKREEYAAGDLPMIRDAEIEGKKYAIYIPYHWREEALQECWFEPAGELPSIQCDEDDDFFLTSAVDAIGFLTMWDIKPNEEDWGKFLKFWEENPDGIIYFE